MEKISYDSVESRLITAINHLRTRDTYLIEHNLHERTIVHRLAIYLEELFPTWHVDCEYNNDRGTVKRITAIHDKLQTFLSKDPTATDLHATDDASGNTQTVFPDLIVHRRSTQENLLVIEVKQNCATSPYDQKKLCLYLSEFGYQYAVLSG